MNPSTLAHTHTCKAFLVELVSNSKFQFPRENVTLHNLFSVQVSTVLNVFIFSLWNGIFFFLIVFWKFQNILENFRYFGSEPSVQFGGFFCAMFKYYFIASRVAVYNVTVTT